MTSKQTLENQKDVFSLNDDNRYVWSEDLKVLSERLIYNRQSMVRKSYLKPHYHIIYLAEESVTVILLDKIQKPVDALAKVKIIYNVSQ